MEQGIIIKNIRDVGELVKIRRKQLGMRQKDAAGLLGVGVRFLSELERGKETLSVGKVLSVVERLNLVVIIQSTRND